jgi:hypothetical protein
MVADQNKGVRMDDESTSSLNLLPIPDYLSKAVISASSQELVKHVHVCELPVEQATCHVQVHMSSPKQEH